MPLATAAASEFPLGQRGGGVSRAVLRLSFRRSRQLSQLELLAPVPPLPLPWWLPALLSHPFGRLLSPAKAVTLVVAMRGCGLGMARGGAVFLWSGTRRDISTGSVGT